jgi:hypothetical protein
MVVSVAAIMAVAHNGGYYDRPYNPWNSVQNRNLIAYNNNSRYYDDYNPLWMNG